MEGVNRRGCPVWTAGTGSLPGTKASAARRGPGEEAAPARENRLCRLQTPQLEDLRSQILGEMRPRGAGLTVSSHQSPGLGWGSGRTVPLPTLGCISMYGCLVPETFQVINK